MYFDFEGYGLALVIVGIVVLCLNGLLASAASDIADDKGYEKNKWFHMCFWLGPIPYIIIAAMPDLKLQRKQDETKHLLSEILEKQTAAAKTQVPQVQARPDDLSSWLPEL